MQRGFFIPLFLLGCGGASIATAQSPGTFNATGNMAVAREFHTATLLTNGKVLIASGRILIGTATAEIYDPSTGTFTATGDLTEAQVCHTATLLGNGKVLIAGGARGSLPTAADAEIYDPAAGAFTVTGSNSSAGVPTCSRANLLPDGRVLVVGADRELYDPGSGTFSLITNGHGWDEHSLTLLMDGSALVAGGDGVPYPFDGAEIYDPSTGAFTAIGNMTAGHAFHTATLLPDGTVLIAGGQLDGGAGTALAELYDPASRRFSAIGGMTTPRLLQTATLLPNGRVLIAGGGTFSAELYTPPVLAPAPVLFAVPGDGQGQGAIWHAATGLVASSTDPAVAGEALSMYTTSLRSGGVIPPQVSVGGLLADILYFGGAPGYPGYSQVNFRVPGGVSPGSAISVRLTYLGRPSNAVAIGVR